MIDFSFISFFIMKEYSEIGLFSLLINQFKIGYLKLAVS